MGNSIQAGPTAADDAAPWRALGLGLIALVCFSLTLPMTRFAVPAFGPELVGPGRSLVAAMAAVPLLIVLRRPLLPPKADLGPVIVVALGSVVGFPFLTALALRNVPASHAAVTIAFLPAATAIMAVLHARERLAPRFWLWCAGGTLLTVGYLALDTRGGLEASDLELVGAVLLCALGYVAGGMLTRRTPAWLTTCWSVIVASPLVLAIVLASHHEVPHLTAKSVLAVVYLGLGSSLIAFFCWYQALAIGGIAKIGQISLLQPLLTMLFAALILGEQLNTLTILMGFTVAITVLMAQRTRQTIPVSNPS
ncbi:DMT family transporter [Spirillospora sp. NBC_01491]|uniref:DMT family transporter n=1 Tax=Spirillospora sp. NBC_01491 TaxID=2976007 RepID=UPI002E33D6B9|nr:DMT family transporter [Spirillospora sp. NBC_01491]